MTAYEQTDLYQILGVAPDATAQQLDRAFRALARRHHPDATQSASAESSAPNDPGGPAETPSPTTDRFQEILSAYAVLRDPIARAAYDRRTQTATEHTASRQASSAPNAARPDPPLRAGTVHWQPPPAPRHDQPNHSV